MKIRLKWVAEVMAGQSPPSETVYQFEGEGLPFLQGNAEFGTRSPKPLNRCDTAARVCSPGDILLSVRAPVGALNVADRRYGIGRGLAALRPRTGRILPGYFWWAMQWAVNDLSASAVGSTYDAVTTDDIRELLIPIPTLDKQRAVIDYLDAETAQIDALIAKKRRMIDLLEERVNARVSDYIRRSPLAGEGGIEAVPIRRVLTKLERWADGGNMVTAFRDGEVTTREARNREGFTNAWTEAARVQQVEVGDVVIHGLDGFSGAIGDARRAGVCSPVYHVCTPKQGDGTFYGRMLRLLALEGYLGNFAISTRERAVDFRNWDLFGRIPVPLVPIDEQRAIGDKIRKIRPLRDRIVASEALALERRQALITEAVTGELQTPVSEAVA